MKSLYFWLIFITFAVAVIICFVSVRRVRTAQRIAKIYQLDLHEIPLVRALLFASVPERHLFLDVQYLQKNKQSGLCFTVPISAMVITKGGIVIFQYLQIAEKLLSTSGTQWNVKQGDSIIPIPDPFRSMETQAKVILSMLRQNHLTHVPVHTYVVLLSEHTQVLQPRDDLIFPIDIPKIITKLEHSNALSHATVNRAVSVLRQYRYIPITNEGSAPAPQHS